MKVIIVTRRVEEIYSWKHYCEFRLLGIFTDPVEAMKIYQENVKKYGADYVVFNETELDKITDLKLDYMLLQKC